MKYKYKVGPVMDHTQMFSQLFDALRENSLVGIFPEGFSHDQCHLIDLKPGVALACLGAAEQGITNLKVIACGVKYSHPNLWRSRLTVEYSTPMEVDTNLVSEFKSNKKSAISKFLAQVKEKMESVMHHAPSYKEKRNIALARKLMIPRPEEHFHPDQNLIDFEQNLYNAYNKNQHDKKMQKLFGEIEEYGKDLKECKLRDSQVYIAGQDKWSASNIIFLLVRMIVVSCLTVPFYITLWPLFIISGYVAEKTRINLVELSPVKNYGADVVMPTKAITSIGGFPLL